jgi:hypothetical protein
MPLPSFHASSVAAWRPTVLRILTAATLAGLLMSFMGVFALGDDPVAARTFFLVAACLAGALLDVLAYGIALRLAWARDSFLRRVGIAAALVAIPTGLAIWASVRLLGRDLGVALLPVFVLNAFVVSGAFIAAVVAPAMDVGLRRAAADALAEEQNCGSARPGAFLERLPRHLRGGELWALKAEDHYLLAITSAGEGLIRLRLADALLELGGIEGAQTHRSWWIARNAVRGVRRGTGRLALVLPNGREVAVSRGLAPRLREAGWL